MVTQNVDFLPFGRFLTLETYLLSEEREQILMALKRNHWNYSAAGRDLHLTLRQMRYRVQKGGLEKIPGKPRPKRSNLYAQAWPKLRAIILKRDHGRCRCCGATAKHGVRLHVDHIKPRSKYPELALDGDNLQVLCEICNLSKSNKDETDWR